MSEEYQWALYPAQEFNQFTTQWDTLNSIGANSLLLSSDFIQPLLKHFAQGNELLAILGDTSSPAAMAIINKTGPGQWTTFQPSQAPMGCWLEKKTTDTQRACVSLYQQLPGFRLTFSITQQDPDIIQRPVPPSCLTTLDYIETARITIDTDFDAYWSQRGKNLRQGLKRQRNRLQRENIESRLVEISSPEQVKDGIIAYGILESAGWKSNTGTAISISNSQGRFYLELMQNFCEQRKGIIYQYWYNKALVATDLCIHDGSTIVILKTTYDQNINTSSPAMLMRQDAFETIFNNRQFKRIEFYGKVMDWHRKWSNEIRTMYHLSYYSKMAIILRGIRSVFNRKP